MGLSMGLFRSVIRDARPVAPVPRAMAAAAARPAFHPAEPLGDRLVRDSGPTDSSPVGRALRPEACLSGNQALPPSASSDMPSAAIRRRAAPLPVTEPPKARDVRTVAVAADHGMSPEPSAPLLAPTQELSTGQEAASMPVPVVMPATPTSPAPPNDEAAPPIASMPTTDTVPLVADKLVVTPEPVTARGWGAAMPMSGPQQQSRIADADRVPADPPAAEPRVPAAGPRSPLAAANAELPTAQTRQATINDAPPPRGHAPTMRLPPAALPAESVAPMNNVEPLRQPIARPSPLVTAAPPAPTQHSTAATPLVQAVTSVIRPVVPALARAERPRAEPPIIEVPRSPEVRIGQVDVFVERPVRASAPSHAGSRPSVSLASRHYLRRL